MFATDGIRYLVFNNCFSILVLLITVSLMIKLLTNISQLIPVCQFLLQLLNVSSMSKIFIF